MPSRHLRWAAAALLVAFCAIALRNACSVLDLSKPAEALAPTRNAAECRVQAGFEADGFEDMVYVNSSTAVSCAGNLGHLFYTESYMRSGGSQSACILIEAGITETASSMAVTTFRPLTILAKTTTKAKMHLHGLDLVLQDGAMLLIAVNHMVQDGLLEDSIEVFRLFVHNASLLHLYSLAYEPSVADSMRGVGNDVTFIASATNNDGIGESLVGELFVSRFIELPDAPEGRAGNRLRNLANRALLYARVAVGRYNTEVLKCTVDTTKSTSLHCTSALTGMLMANGVVHALLPAARLTPVVISVDVLTHRLVVASTSALLKRDSYTVPYVQLLHAVDNIVVDVRFPPVCRETSMGGSRCVVHLLGGVIGSVWHASKIESMSDLKYRSPGGTSSIALEVVVDASGALTSATLVGETVLVMHEGSFQGVSVGVVLESPNRRVNDGDVADAASKGVIVMGSYKVQGLMICPTPFGDDDRSL